MLCQSKFGYKKITFLATFWKQAIGLRSNMYENTAFTRNFWYFKKNQLGQLGKDLQRHCKDYLWQTLQGLPLTMLILGGINWWSTWKGSTKTLQGLPLTMLILGVDLQSTWKGSAKTLQGLPDNVDPGGLIYSQLGKDLQRYCKDYLWQCWSWGVNWWSTWKGSAKTLQGLSLTMLILGGWLMVNLERIYKDIVRITSNNVDPGEGQMMVNLERIHKDIARITSVNVDPGRSIDRQLGKDPQRHCKDYLWQCWSWGGQLGKDPQRHCKDYLWQCWSGGSIDGHLGKDPQWIWKDYIWKLHIIMRSLCSHTSRA